MIQLLLSTLLLLGTPDPGQSSTSVELPSAPVAPVSSQKLPAAGMFAQTGITGLDVRVAGPGNATILSQTSVGVVTGTMSGSFEDDLVVVIRPNGTFSAAFTLTVEATLAGRQGVVTLQAADVGQLLGPTTAHFSGVAVVTDATGGLEGLRGSLVIEGEVDLTSGLSTYTYAGSLTTSW